MKITKAHIGLILIAIMFFSTFAYAGLQSLFFGTTSPQSNLPNTNIIDYQLSPDQESNLIQHGVTIALLRWNANCSGCLGLKNQLENLASSNEYKNQLLLEEIESAINASSISISSLNGQRNLNNVTTQNVTGVLCDLVYSPPASCALRKLS